jgi:hypothetical protein
VDDIYRFNSQFLTQLLSCGLDPVEVARCFVRNNSGFTIYTDYCTKLPQVGSHIVFSTFIFSLFLFIVRRELDGN